MVEMVLKLVGLGCVAYWADGWNKLDGTIVLLSAGAHGRTATTPHGRKCATLVRHMFTRAVSDIN